MNKFLNLFFLLIILVSCGKEEIDVPIYLDEDISFLHGEWKWKELLTGSSQTTQKIFIKASNEPQIVCSILFNSSNQLTIVTESSESTIQLYLTGLNETNDIKVISFRTSENEVIRFTFSESLNLLYTDKKLFDIPILPCFENYYILNSTYEKV